jgi:hypothetical protein
MSYEPTLPPDIEAQAVWGCLERAITRFNESADRDGLLHALDKNKPEGPAASERAIAHRLAFYLESELRDVGLVDDCSPLAVDCEYNRHQGAPKAVAVEKKLKSIVEKARRKALESEEDGFYVFSVAPDVVVHQRGTDDRNRLVIELKKASNPEIRAYDALKLGLFTDKRDRDEGYGYNYGAWVVAEDKCALDQRKLRIETRYEGGRKIS